MEKESKILSIIGRLNAKYWHLPFGDTSSWLESDRLLLERCLKFYEKD